VTEKINITHPTMHQYLEDVRPPSDDILQEMEATAIERGFPYLGAQCSRILYQLAKISGAKRIFELGSGFGYTMYWMAKAVPADGMVIGTDSDPENCAAANDFFRRGRIADRTDIRCGDALQLLAPENGPFDLVYCDIDKESYPEAFEMSKPRLRPGGILIADNVLWSGRIADPSVADDETEAIREFTRRIFADPDFFTTIIPIRDGMSISVKTGS
jgi:predicted O-methyltransferase YrrM